MSEFCKFYEEFDVLRWKEFVVVVVFMENVYEILNDDLGEVRKEFNKVRDVV